jgi:hypothetical protein
MQSKLPFIILVISASLLLVAIAIIPTYHQASAKECNGSSCSDDKQSSDSNSNNDGHKNEHSSNSDDSVKKDNTPFVLSTPVPFP